MSTEAMKLALEALETIAKVEHPSHKVTYRKPVNGHVVTIYPHKVATDAIIALKQALEQPGPEPDRKAFERYWKKTRGEKKSDRELKRHPLQPQVYIQDSANRHWVTWQAATKKASPPKREWQGLTDWEINSVANNNNPLDGIRSFARAIEAKLKEKNT